MRVKGILIFATKLTKVISFHVIQHHQGIVIFHSIHRYVQHSNLIHNALYLDRKRR